jgi:hypothetical protein
MQKTNHYSYYQRPGDVDFIRRLTRHPRCSLAFYTSIKTENAKLILEKVLPKDLIKKVRFFGREFTSEMSENKYFE